MLGCINDQAIKEIVNINGYYHSDSDAKNIISEEFSFESGWMWDDNGNEDPSGIEILLKPGFRVRQIKFVVPMKNMLDVRIFINNKEISHIPIVDYGVWNTIDVPTNEEVLSVKILRYANSDCGINKILLMGSKRLAYEIPQEKPYETDKTNIIYNLLEINNKLYSIKEEFFDNTMQQFIPIPNLDMDNITKERIFEHGFIDIKNVVLDKQYSKNIIGKLPYSVLPYSDVTLDNKNKSLKLNSKISGTLPVRLNEDNITVEFWANTDEKDKRLFSFNDYAIVIHKGKIAITTGNEDYYNSDFIYINKWVHIAAIFTCSGLDAIYIDGNKLSLEQEKEPSVKNIIKNFTIGGTTPVLINNLKIWKIIRTQDEIINDMTITLQEDYKNENLIGFYPMNEIKENKILDNSMYRNDISIKKEDVDICDNSPIQNRFIFRINNKLYNTINNKLNFVSNHVSEEDTKNIIEKNGLRNFNIFDHELLSRYRKVEILLSINTDNKKIFAVSKIFKPIDKLKLIGEGKAKIIFAKPIPTPSIVDLELKDKDSAPITPKEVKKENPEEKINFDKELLETFEALEKEHRLLKKESIKRNIDKIDNFTLKEEPNIINVKKHIQSLLDDKNIQVKVTLTEGMKNHFKVSLSNGKTLMDKSITVTRKDGEL